jgi:PelA/Pel-15E family pectate lyase
MNRLCLSTVAVVLLAVPAAPAPVGVSAPPPSLSEARIATLPAGEQPPWRDYLARSVAQEAADKAALVAERARLAGPIPPPPPEHTHDASMPLDRAAAWYAGADARHIADVIVSFQTPAGGWGKNQDRSGAVRQPGQDYVADNTSQFLKLGDFDTPREVNWHYVGTLDNDATTTELRFLARVSAAVPGPAGEAYRTSFVKGVRYLLAAQYPNGGWPQVWPLEGGYHDAITYNDNAVAEAAEVLHAVAADEGGLYGFVPADVRAGAAAAEKKALDVILKTQIVAGGVRTIWAQQHDALTLAPVAARNFEPALPSTEESADLLLYLMRLPAPAPDLVAAIHGAAAWLQKAAIAGYKWTGAGTPAGRHLEAALGAGPIWARYYTVDFQPRFGERDKTIHDSVDDISLERRNGYSWFNTAPAKALKAYRQWAEARPAP